MNNKLSTSLSKRVPQFEGTGNAISQALIKGINTGLNNIIAICGSIVSIFANDNMNNKQMVYNIANSLGKNISTQFKTGVNPMTNYMVEELSYVKSEITDKQTELGNAAYNLGSHIASSFKEGEGINSPGLMIRAMKSEWLYW